MKPQDLRIGNLILVNDVLQEVCQIPLPENCTEENTKPIALTEEWLLKLGFIPDRGILFEAPIHIQEKCKEDNGFKKSAFFFNNRVDINSWMDCQTRVCVKYVHQVQNLIYALSGEELKAEL